MIVTPGEPEAREPEARGQVALRMHQCVLVTEELASADRWPLTSTEYIVRSMLNDIVLFDQLSLARANQLTTATECTSISAQAGHQFSELGDF